MPSSEGISPEMLFLGRMSSVTRPRSTWVPENKILRREEEGRRETKRDGMKVLGDC